MLSLLCTAAECTPGKGWECLRNPVGVKFSELQVDRERRNEAAPKCRSFDFVRRRGLRSG
jgi:hypothetical protein